MNNIKTVSDKLLSMGFNPLTKRTLPGGYNTERLNVPKEDSDCRLALFFGKQRGRYGRMLQCIHVVSIHCLSPDGMAKEWRVCNEIKRSFPETRVIGVGCCRFDK